MTGVQTCALPILATTYDNAIAGIPVTLTTATAPAAGLTAYPANVTNQAVLTIDYPAIRKATTTQSSDNSITIPITTLGLGGTQGFYTGMMLFFVGETFGGLVENEKYYVTTVIDNERFTISAKSNPIQTTIYGSLGSADLVYPNCVVCDSNVEFSVNDPIIFNATFGGIVAGQVYYISSLNGSGHFTVANAPNSTNITLTTSSATGTVVNQKDVVQLSDATGSVNTEINLPISPGQITGQLFTLYQTSNYTEEDIVEEVYSNLFTKAVKATIGQPYTTVINRVLLDATKLGEVYQVYNNMPIRIDHDIGGLTAGTTYYVIDNGMTTVNVSSTSSTGNILTCDHADLLYVNMPILFTGTSLGGVLIGVQYYVESIPSATTFTISATVGGSATTLYNESGDMVGTGEAYVKLSSSKGGSSVTLSDVTASTPTITLTQYPTSDENLAVRHILGGYDVYIIDGGSGYAIDNVLTISGDQFPGGSSPQNDLVMTVNTIDSDGAITGLIRSGTPTGTVSQYYLKAIDENQLADRKSTRLNSSHIPLSRMPSSA